MPGAIFVRHSLLCGSAALAMLLSVAACGDDKPTAPTSVTFVAQMSGTKERPNANGSPATGVATYVLKGNTITYTLTASGLTAPASASHLHIGGPDVAGPVLVPYVTANVSTGQITSGSIDLSGQITNGSVSISGDSLRALLNNGNAYSNIHNANYPGGEIRGQLIRQGN